MSKIKWFSPVTIHDLIPALQEMKYMEGGGYISDYLHGLPRGSYTQTAIPARYAKLILKEMGVDIHDFGNKNFVKITRPEDVKGYPERVMHTFLYLHDFTWYLYDIES